jgi:hypothetical protein
MMDEAWSTFNFSTVFSKYPVDDDIQVPCPVCGDEEATWAPEINGVALRRMAGHITRDVRFQDLSHEFWSRMGGSCTGSHQALATLADCTAKLDAILKELES